MRRSLLRRAGLELLALGLPAAVVLLGVPPFSWSVAAGLVACTVLPLRHLSPALALVGVLPGLAGGLGWAPALVALFALGRRARSPRSVAPWLVLPVVAAVAPVFATQDLPWQQGVLTVGYVVINVVAPVVVGLLVATRARLVRSLAELDRARESAVVARSEAARAQERARIGREIHDAVGHHVTLIAVGAAALAASTREESTRAAAEQLGTLARRSLGEVRAALGLTGKTAAAAAGPAQLGDVARLVEEWRAAGLEIDLALDEAPGEVRPLVGRAAYRVVQESLTNAARHAPGAPVRVVVQADGDELAVRVDNGPAAGRRDLDGAGTGLVGLAERVRSAEGRFHAGPRPGGGFRVEARFPLPRVPAGTAEGRPAEATSDGGVAVLGPAG